MYATCHVINCVAIWGLQVTNMFFIFEVNLKSFKQRLWCLALGAWMKQKANNRDNDSIFSLSWVNTIVNQLTMIWCKRLVIIWLDYSRMQDDSSFSVTSHGSLPWLQSRTATTTSLKEGKLPCSSLEKISFPFSVTSNEELRPTWPTTFASGTSTFIISASSL